MQIEFGDNCYYYLYNKVYKVYICKKFTKVHEVMLAYEQAWELMEIDLLKINENNLAL